MRRLAFALLSALALTGCVSSRSGPDPIVAAVQRWRECVTRSFASQRTTTSDRSLAVEMAFVACRTEEDAIMSFATPNSYPAASRAVSTIKAKTKSDLVAG